MNTRNLLVSILMLGCILLSACTPATTPSSPAKVVPSAATFIPTIPISSPTTMPTSLPTNTAIPPIVLPTSDLNALAAVAGAYSYYGSYRILLRSDGTYASLPSTGIYSVTSDEITFADSLMIESGTVCGSELGVYKWSVDNNVLTLTPIRDDCSARSYIFSSNTFKKVQEAVSAPVEFVWRITGAPHPFVRPVNIAVDEQSNIYIVDGGNHRIQKFNMNGKFLRMWGEYGGGDGQFIFQVAPDHFGAVAVDSSGNVYVTDYNSRVQKFDSNGKFLMKWGTPGDGDGQFAVHSHMSIAVDASGNVYVSDTNNYRIQKFDANGKFLLKWGDKGNGNGQFWSSTDWNGPEGIAVDDQGNVYVADPANYRIQKFDANGNFLSQWGSQGTGDGQFLDAGDVAVDQQGNIYVTDNQQNVGGPTNQVSKFDSNGKFLLKWGETGPGLGMLNFPAGIAVDKQGNIYVVNVIENVQKFQP